MLSGGPPQDRGARELPAGPSRRGSCACGPGRPKGRLARDPCAQLRGRPLRVGRCRCAAMAWPCSKTASRLNLQDLGWNSGQPIFGRSFAICGLRRRPATDSASSRLRGKKLRRTLPYSPALQVLFMTSFLDRALGQELWRRTPTTASRSSTQKHSAGRGTCMRSCATSAGGLLSYPWVIMTLFVLREVK